MVSKRISIIDITGIKAGMNYYNDALANCFNNNIKTFIISNYRGTEKLNIRYKIFFPNKKQLISSIKVGIGFIKTLFFIKFKRIKFNIIHIFYVNNYIYYIFMLFKIFNINLTVILHDVSSFFNNDNYYKKNRIFRYYANNIVVHNNYSYNEFCKLFPSVKKMKVKIIKHGHYLNSIRIIDKNIARKYLNISKEDKIMLFFGQIKYVKGLDILIEAMKYIDPSIKLIIAGKPQDNSIDDIENLINIYKLNNRIIKIIKYINDDEKDYIYSATDIVILPYRKIYQSGVLLMALSFGLPCIVSDLPSNLEIINNNNGYIFKSEDALSLANEIDKYFSVKKNENNKNMSIIRSTIKNYNWNDIAKEYEKLIFFQQEREALSYLNICRLKNHKA